MPIRYTIAATGRVRSRASGTVDYADAQAHLLAKHRAGVLSAPEIFDARDVTLDFSMTELRAIAEEVRKRVDGTPGPIAFVTNSAFVKGLAETYAALTMDHNPQFRIFTSLPDAEAWLEKVSIKLDPQLLSKNSPLDPSPSHGTGVRGTLCLTGRGR